ncbi:Crp/Fnr family transcriptional regulator [Sphingobium sp. SCG-1]|uniref:Crp/Fnr family transcriptional regulator n=1 Tax=Sphingobium sp. SCG-1 TaxID=2072936 RepID=UPI001670C403|nr:Crp/Fnr family transcriptional regulator [Sphingobium sp. SCG-1]
MSDENWIAALPSALQSIIETRSIDRSYAVGETIGKAGSPPPGVMQVRSGYVRLHGLQEDGRQTLIAIYSQGNCFAETAVLGRRCLNHTTTALSPTEIRILPAKDFWELCSAYPEIPEALCRKLAAALGRQIANRELKASKRLGQCIGVILQNASNAFGRSYVDGVEITCPISQQDLADHLDVTRQSVQREVSQLKRSGMIARSGRRWMIRDGERLRDFCSA